MNSNIVRKTVDVTKYMGREEDLIIKKNQSNNMNNVNSNAHMTNMTKQINNGTITSKNMKIY
jgi:hypothetical protein